MVNLIDQLFHYLNPPIDMVDLYSMVDGICYYFVFCVIVSSVFRFLGTAAMALFNWKHW